MNVNEVAPAPGSGDGERDGTGPERTRSSVSSPEGGDPPSAGDSRVGSADSGVGSRARSVPPPTGPPPTGRPAGAADREAWTALAVRASDGDRAAFEELHRAFAPALERFFARRGHSREVTDELAQRSWFESWRAIESGRYDASRSAISTFVIAVAHRVELRYRRDFLRGRARIERWAERRDDSPPPPVDRAIDEASLLEALTDCLARLRSALDEASPPDRGGRTILESIVTGRTEREIAAEIGLAPSTIHARKKALLARLRRCLAQRGWSDENAREVLGEG